MELSWYKNNVKTILTEKVVSCLKRHYHVEFGILLYLLGARGLKKWVHVYQACLRIDKFFYMLTDCLRKLLLATIEHQSGSFRRVAFCFPR